MDWIEETRLRLLLTMGLAGGEADAYSDSSEFETETEAETVVVTQMIVPSTSAAGHDERDEADKTEVGYRESPERVKLEVIEIHSGEPISAASGLPGQVDVASHSKTHAHHGESGRHGHRHTPSHLAHKDEEAIVAEEAGL